MKILIPPQPRYLFSGCCRDKGHCTNVAKPDHASTLLGSTMHLREVLKKKLVGKLSAKFWICDSCLAGSFNPNCTITERKASLESVFTADGVHFTTVGYRNIAKNISEVVKDLAAGLVGKASLKTSAVPSVVSGMGRTHFWRGISSPVGSNKPSSIPHHHKYRDKSRSTTPYSRFGGGGGRTKMVNNSS